jgi:hypothetical protein
MSSSFCSQVSLRRTNPKNTQATRDSPHQHVACVLFIKPNQPDLRRVPQAILICKNIMRRSPEKPIMSNSIRRECLRFVIGIIVFTDWISLIRKKCKLVINKYMLFVEQARVGRWEWWQSAIISTYPNDTLAPAGDIIQIQC